MKLLFDENISFRVLNKTKSVFPGSSHVKYHNLISSFDSEIRAFALKHKFTIVTHDSDFNDLTSLFGFPPKIIWLQTGNTSTQNITGIILKNELTIKDFINDSKTGTLIIKE